MDFFLFGPSERGLFGTYSEGSPSGALSGTAVLLCPPWGQEAVRTHRMLRVLAERLARAGAHVLRFDYHGTGDAPGDDEAVTLAGCAHDVVQAQAQLVKLSRPRRVIWIGVRLGATSALRALADPGLDRRPDHLVAWEPVIDGAAYLRALREDHVKALEASYTTVDPQWRIDLARTPERFDHEAMGFGVSQAFRAELAALDAASLAGGRIERLSVLVPTGSGTAAGLQAVLGTGVANWETLTVDHDFDWTSEEALNTALVPGAAVQTLFEQCLVR